MIKNIKYLLLIIVIVSVSFLLTVPNYCAEDNSKTIKVGIEDNNSKIVLSKEDILDLTLESNVSTGYSWEYETEPESYILSEINHSYIGPENPMPGAGGNEKWLYYALNEGVTTLKLKYMRSWDTDSVINTYTLNIEVAQTVSDSDVSVKTTIANEWASGGQISIVVTNNGSTATDGWSVPINVPGIIANIWGAKGSGSGEIILTNELWNGEIQPGNSIQAGLIYNK